MNNIIELYDIEFKRIKKPYFLLILGFILSNIAMFTFKIFRYTNTRNFNLVEAINNFKLKINENGYILYDIIELSKILLIMFVLLALIYGVVIWYRDFYFKEKTSYVLYLLPQNKMNIFFSKLLVVVNIIYTLTLTQIMIYLMFDLFIKNIIGFDTTLQYYKFPIMFSFREFFIINILGVVCAVSMIFMCTLFSIYSKKIGIVSFFTLIPISIFLYLYLDLFKWNISIFITNLVYLILLIGLSFFVSSKLINKIDF